MAGAIGLLPAAIMADIGMSLIIGEVMLACTAVVGVIAFVLVPVALVGGLLWWLGAFKTYITVEAQVELFDKIHDTLEKGVDKMAEEVVRHLRRNSRRTQMLSETWRRRQRSTIQSYSSSTGLRQ